jgi:hypothetical protein
VGAIWRTCKLGGSNRRKKCHKESVLPRARKNKRGKSWLCSHHPQTVPGHRIPRCRPNPKPKNPKRGRGSEPWHHVPRVVKDSSVLLGILLTHLDCHLRHPLCPKCDSTFYDRQDVNPSSKSLAILSNCPRIGKICGLKCLTKLDVDTVHAAICFSMTLRECFFWEALGELSTV